MGDSSMAAEDIGMVGVGKVETAPGDPSQEGTPSSVESTPEQEVPAGPSQDAATAQPQKRKGGRKPIYATSEERKQRNRQAQAAFRERRTEYIKQLEATIQQNEGTLAQLQQSQRTAADECLMLRYKNSLLERILLEKGIDVQAELQLKTGSPILGPAFMPPGMQQGQTSQPQLQRAAVQRQQARRSGQGFLPKLAPGQATADLNFTNSSPSGHPTPSSHASSPNSMPTRSPMAMHQGGMTPPTSAGIAQGQSQHYHAFSRPAQQQQPQPNTSFYPQSQQKSPSVSRQQQQRPTAPSNYQSSASISSQSGTSQHSMSAPMSAGGQGQNGSMGGPIGMSSAPGQPSAYYPSPFQKHIDQLEQEYDTQQTQSMLDHPDHDDPMGHVQDHQRSAPSGSVQLQGSYPPQPQQFGQQLHAQSGAGAQYYPQTFSAGGMQQQQHPQRTSSYNAQPPPQMMQTSQPEGAGGHFAMAEVVDPNDPMLDADPFGLSASMHYPTSYGAMDHHPQQR